MSLNLLRESIIPFVLFLLLTIKADDLSRQCPPKESLPSCTCKQLDEGPVINCTQVTTTLELITSTLKGYAVSQLILADGRFDVVSADQFVGLHIQDLVITNLDVYKGLDPELWYLKGLENYLTDFELTKSFKSKPLVTLRMEHLLRLETLIFHDTGIQEVTKDWFAGGPQSLKHLIFERNHIKSVGDKAFASLKNLVTFALAGNSLSTLPRSILPQPANHLNTLDVAFNTIKNIPEDFFTDMPSLRYVNLDHNAIVTLPETVISPVWNQLLGLNFDGNPLRCDSEMKWMCSAEKTRIISVTGKCQEPPEAAGKSITDVCKSFEFLSRT